MTFSEIIASVQAAKHAQHLRFAHHPLQQAFERDIFTSHIEQALDSDGVEVIPDCSDPDLRNPSPACIVLGRDDRNRALHVVIAYYRMLVVTSYEPTPPKWVTPRERGVSP